MTPDLPAIPGMTNRRSSEPNHKRTRGFSMIETMIVATVIAVLTAIAVPTIGRGLQLYRLGSAATDVANILERTRYEAIHRNTIVSCRYVQQGTRWLFWIDLNGNGKADRKSTRLNSSHIQKSRMPSSA